jgi:concanavalin A-like lectin/glucanase superfamily protein
MASWIIQYYTGSAWVTKTDAVIEQIIDEVNGQLGTAGQQEFDFIIPNTPANMTFVQTDQQVQILWGNTSVFAGLLRAYKAKFTTITATVYNNVFELMRKQTITGKYNGVAASTVLAAVCAACGMTVGSCPTIVISTQFNATDCYTAALNIANILGLNLFNSGNTVNIALKGNQTPTAITIDTESEVDIDRSKAGYDGVIIRGVDQAGNAIIGSAGNTGAGYSVKTLTNKIGMDQATLNSLAAEYLQSLQQTNSGSPLVCDISQAALLNSGDLITVTNGSVFGLSGSYEIAKITKTLVKATIDIVHSSGDFANLVDAIASSTTALNTLPVSSDQVQGSSVSLQNLLGLYHLDEGNGTVAIDNSTNNNNGAIGSGNTWFEGPYTKALKFNGAGSYVDIPANIVDFSGLSKFSVTGWFSPTAAAFQYIVYKANQFFVQLQADGTIVFGLYIAGSWITLASPAASAALNGRLFITCIYDGAKMYLYLNGPLIAQKNQTGVIGNSNSDTIIGAMK